MDPKSKERMDEDEVEDDDDDDDDDDMMLELFSEGVDSMQNSQGREMDRDEWKEEKKGKVKDSGVGEKEVGGDDPELWLSSLLEADMEEDMTHAKGKVVERSLVPRGNASDMPVIRDENDESEEYNEWMAEVEGEISEEVQHSKSQKNTVVTMQPPQEGEAEDWELLSQLFDQEDQKKDTKRNDSMRRAILPPSQSQSPSPSSSLHSISNSKSFTPPPPNSLRQVSANLTPTLAGTSLASLSSSISSFDSINSHTVHRPLSGTKRGASALTSFASGSSSSSLSKTKASTPLARILSEDEDGAIDISSGIRLINRLLSTFDLSKKLANLQVMPLTRIPHPPSNSSSSSPSVSNSLSLAVWGVISFRSPIRDTKKGEKYIQWKLTDLNAAEVTLFLFSDAFKSMWKEEEGLLVYIANPRILPPAPTSSFAKPSTQSTSLALSVSSAEQILIIGRCRDFGYCGAFRNDHRTVSDRDALAVQRCRNVLDKRKGLYCPYHIKKEYQRALATRPEINQVAGSMRTGKVHFGANNAGLSMIDRSSGPGFMMGNQLIHKNVSTKSGISVQAKSEKMQKLLSKVTTTSKMVRRLHDAKEKGEKEQREGKRMDFDSATLVVKRATETLNALGLDKIYNPNTNTNSNTIPPNYKHTQNTTHQQAPATSSFHSIHSFHRQPHGNTPTNEKENIKQSHNLATPSVSSMPSNTVPPVTRTGIHANSSSMRVLSMLNASVKKDANSHNNCGDAIQKPIQANTSNENGDNRTQGSIASMPPQSRVSSASGRVPLITPKPFVFNPNASPIPTPMAGVKRSADAPLNAEERRKRQQLEKETQAIIKNGGVPRPDPNAISQASSTDMHQIMAATKSRPSLLEAAVVTSEGVKFKKSVLKKMRESKKEVKFTPQSMFGLSLATDAASIRKLLERQSSHANLIVDDISQLAALFGALDKLEQMQTTMESIKKLKVNAFYCQECKTKTEHSVEGCRVKQHAIQKIQAIKRWFLCGKCKKRTSTLDSLLPLQACSHCNSNRWQRTGMHSVKSSGGNRDELLIRGEEGPRALRSDFGGSAKTFREQQELAAMDAEDARSMGVDMGGEADDRDDG